MLATLVIGLREGLEAALIVGIIAAFLRRNGHTLTAMWAGVALAVALSVIVGVGLSVLEQALPQASQEGMESIIGAIAVVFVTGMIAWMNTHARSMKKELEAEAAEALSHTGAFALASMAFLAVLKEGFETSVFLLATFSAAQSALLAAVGAVVGLLIAVAIGWGIYVGGVKLNLSRFFRITGAFLILVAAGLVVTVLRTGHEAGWLNAGQQATVGLGWLVAPGTIQSALITGVLGIPADPRRIELIGWLAYLVPVAAYVYWPRAWRPAERGRTILRYGIAAVLALTGFGLALAYPRSAANLGDEVPVVAADGSALGSVRVGDLSNSLSLKLNGTAEQAIVLPAADAHSDRHGGLDTTAWTLPLGGAPADAPATLTADQVIALAGGRAPVGLNVREHPGPYTAAWSRTGTLNVWMAGGALLDAEANATTVVTLSGGGLQTPRTVRVSAGADGDWQVAPDYRAQAAAELGNVAAADAERQFWALELPIGLLVVALVLAISTGRRPGQPTPTQSNLDHRSIKTSQRAAKSTLKGEPHAAL